MLSLSYLVLVVTSLLAIRLADARDVFAHYMVGSVTKEHAEQDIDNAIAMGLDAFSLNIGFPQADHVFGALVFLFDHADALKAQGSNFRLFISMDLWAAGDHKHADGSNVNAFDYGDTFRDFITRSSYYLGPNGKPFVTTFSDGGMNNDSFIGWRETLSSTGVYFVPDLDHTLGFNTSHPEWWKYWGPIFDGVTAWESAWPYRAGYGGYWPGDTRWDKQVIEGIDGNPGTLAHGKTYMMPMSSIQYKAAYETNVYREGGLNLVQRMKETLAMANGPDFIQIITWNDGPESHYIGNIWPEQNTDFEPSLYMSSTKGNHKGWQPLIHSFIIAFKQGARDVSQMALPPGTANHFVGAIWYKQVLSAADCSNIPGATKPDGYETAQDRLTWAVIVDGSASFSVSDGTQEVTLSPGLNFGEFDLKEGPPRVTLKSNGVVVGTASGGPCTYKWCPDGIYNLNVEVVAFTTTPRADVSCSQRVSGHGQILLQKPTTCITTRDRKTTCALITKHKNKELTDEQLWEDSGARAFLDCAVKNWPKGDIDMQMEMLARDTEAPSSSCSDLTNGICAYDEETCETQHGTVETYFVRKAFSQFYAVAKSTLMEQFVATSQGTNSLVDDMVETFADKLLAPRGNDGSGLHQFAKVVGGSLSMASEVPGLPGGGIAGVAGGALGYIEEFTEPGDYGDIKEDMAKAIRAALWAGFDNYRAALRNTSNAIFVEGDLGKFRPWSFVQGGKAVYPLGKFFDKGRYISLPTAAYQPALEASVRKTIRLSILNLIMKASSVYILVGAHSDPAGSGNNKCNFPLSRWDGKNCYAIEYAGAGPGVSLTDTDVSVFTTQLSSAVKEELVTFAENTTQTFNLMDIVTGSEECQQATGKFDGEMDSSSTPGTLDQPLCTWNLPVIYPLPYTDDFPGSSKSSWYHSPCKIRYYNRDNTIHPGDRPGWEYLPPNLDDVWQPDDHIGPVFSVDWCWALKTPPT